MNGYRFEGSPHYIIDGYNVLLHKSYAHRQEDIGASRDRFIMLLGAYRMKRRVQMTVVWDGSGSAFSRMTNKNGVRCVYTAPGVSADEKIVHMVEGMTGRRGLTVVSDDRRHITGWVRNLGAQVMGVEQFLTLVGGIKRKSGFVNSPEESSDDPTAKKMADDLSVEDWLTLFKAKEQKE